MEYCSASCMYRSQAILEERGWFNFPGNRVSLICIVYYGDRMYARGNRLPGAASPLLMKMHSRTSLLPSPPFSLPRYFRVAYPFASVRRSPTFLVLPFSSAGRHSSTSLDSQRMPHSRSTPRMLSAHRCTAVFSWSFSFCRTVAQTPSRPRTQGTDIYTSLSVPWTQLCKQKFLDLVSSVAPIDMRIDASQNAFLQRK